jgi:hypothetical protein
LRDKSSQVCDANGVPVCVIAGSWLFLLGFQGFSGKGGKAFSGSGKFLPVLKLLNLEG